MSVSPKAVDSKTGNQSPLGGAETESFGVAVGHEEPTPALRGPLSLR
jgi:hypothetical protein